MVTQESLQQRPLSYSSLKEFGKSPAHYIEYLRKERKSTPAMLFGSMVHCMILQPDQFDNQFAVMENVDRRTKEGKAKYEEFLIASAGKEVVTQEQHDEVALLCNKVLSMPHIKTLVDNCHTFEQEWRQDINGLPFRGFFDGVSDEYILEIKTTNDASPKNITNDFFNRQYHMQGGLYNHVSGKKVKYLIIETAAPYNVMVADADTSFLEKGMNDVLRLSSDFKSCMDGNMFDMGYDFFTEGQFVVNLPAWVK